MLQNPLITAIIFDIALSRDLRQLQTSPDTGEGGEAEGTGEQYDEVKFFFLVSLPSNDALTSFCTSVSEICL